MDRERNSTRTVYRSYVIDDGWNVPKEVIEAVDLRIEEAWAEKLYWAKDKKLRHQGDWLTMEVAEKYRRLAAPFLAFFDGQYIKTVRELGKELQEKYGITEIEAINILRGYYIHDYVDKYYRIKNIIPDGVDEQEICNEVLGEYGYCEIPESIAM